MFTSRLITLAFVLVFAIVNAVATPVPEPVNIRLGVCRHRLGYLIVCRSLFQHALAQRDASPFEPIPAYMKRDGLYSVRLPCS